MLMGYMKKFLFYLFFAYTSAFCFALDVKEELWRRFVESKDFYVLNSGSTDNPEDIVADAKRKNMYIDFFSELQNFECMVDIGNCSIVAKEGESSDEPFLTYILPFVKDKAILFRFSAFSLEKMVRFESLLAYKSNSIKVKIFCEDDSDRANKSYTYISISNCEYEK